MRMIAAAIWFVSRGIFLGLLAREGMGKSTPAGSGPPAHKAPGGTRTRDLPLVSRSAQERGSRGPLYPLSYRCTA